MSKIKSERKKWFGCLKGILKIFIKKPKFIYIGKKIEKGSILLTNHVGASGPLTYELYCDFPMRFWGTHEMNSGLIKVYKYLTKTYYHEKKHWNIHLARLFCLIAAPLCNLFYKGLNLIATYQDTRFRWSLKESKKTLIKGHNIVIFPEMSEKGYFDELTGFHDGFAVFLDYCKKHGLNVPVYVGYFRKKEKVCLIDKPIYSNDLLDLKLSREELASKMCARCNQLGKLNLTELVIEQ